jgi:fatty-acyl-CoA synthase
MVKKRIEKYQSLTQALYANFFSKKRIHLLKSGEAETSFTYQQLYQKARAILFQLQSGGIKSGDQLIIAVDDQEIFLDVFWACLLGKIIAVPVTLGNNDENKHKILKIWSTLRKPYLVTNQKIFADLAKIAHEESLLEIAALLKQRIFFDNEFTKTFGEGELYHSLTEDVAFIQFSSGSTGTPKGVILTHQNLLTNIKAIINCAKITESDSTLSWLPLTHDMGLIGFHLVPLVSGITQYILPTSLFVRRPMLWMEKAHQYKTTLLCSPNFGYKYFLSFFHQDGAKHWELSHVRLIFNGAEPISKQLCDNFLDRMGNYGLKRTTLFPVYGLAEAALAVTFPPVEEELVYFNLNRSNLKVGDQIEIVAENANNKLTFVDVGYAVDDCSVRICDKDNKLLSEGKVGYIQIKGKNVTSGYYNNNNATAQTILEAGWLNTGDLGFIQNGRLVITGRAKEIIFINGQNYYPHDIERVVAEVEGVELGEVAAFGIYSEAQQNEAVILAVLFKKTVEKFLPLVITLKKHLHKQMGLTVKEVIPVKKIPKTTSGKIMRFKLKEMYQEGCFAAIMQEIDQLLDSFVESKVGNQPESLIEGQLWVILAELLKNRKIGIDNNFMEIGLDSLLITKFCAQIEARQIAKLTIMDLFSYPTIRKLAEFIAVGKGDHSRNLLSDLQIKIPTTYFHNAVDFSKLNNNDSIYLFEIPYTLLTEINSISDREKIAIDQIFLALFIYHLYLITEQTKFTVQTMINQKNQVTSLVVDLDDVEEISELFQRIAAKLSSNEETTYFLHNISNITLNKGADSIVPFFYKETLLTDKSQLFRVYDLTLGIYENSSTIGLVFDYDRERLNQTKIKQFVDTYIQLIYAITQYKTNNGVIAK